MAAESLIHFAETPTAALHVRVSCPSCGGRLVFDNGVRHVTDGVGVAAVAILSCPNHGPYEIRMQMMRAPVGKPKRPSGAAQRRARAEREAQAVRV